MWMLAWVPAFAGMASVVWMPPASLAVIPAKAGTHASFRLLAVE
jgi:hypothetical protein